MATKIPSELGREIAEHPRQAIPVLDAATGKTYYLCDEAFLFGDGVESELSRQQLKTLIEEGLASGNVDRDEAHARMRATIDRYRGADARCD